MCSRRLLIHFQWYNCMNLHILEFKRRTVHELGCALSIGRAKNGIDQAFLCKKHLKTHA